MFTRPQTYVTCNSNSNSRLYIFRAVCHEGRVRQDTFAVENCAFYSKTHSSRGTKLSENNRIKTQASSGEVQAEQQDNILQTRKPKQKQSLWSSSIR